MSLRSMTGYGHGSATGGGVTVDVELTSVNRKQLDLQMNLPRGLTALEPRILEEIHQCISRGRVTVDLSVRWTEEKRRKAIRVDYNLAEEYVKSLRRMGARLGLEDNLDVNTLLSLPEVVRYARPEEDVDQIWDVAGTALSKALKGLVRMRAREGRELQKDIEDRLDLLRRHVGQIRGETPRVLKRHRNALKERLRSAGWEPDAKDDRFHREVVYYADRSDITEELTRLESHLKQARKMIRSKDATGRSMDFLAQEIFREINTIGSKANDAKILNAVVRFKTELERIREQVQNIE